jgi:hypothetical protein
MTTRIILRGPHGRFARKGEGTALAHKNGEARKRSSRSESIKKPVGDDRVATMRRDHK